MRYTHMLPGIFICRPNRFIAHILIGGKEEICHVKNTGRCRELLVPGAQVWCQASDNASRKTKYDLICVEKAGRLINIDSQAPNAAVKEWLQGGGLGEIENLRAESVHGASRFDFSFTRGGQISYLEVKGVTLESQGICAFPDAPTTRGARHMRELAELSRSGLGAYALFVIQMSRVKAFRPNDATDPAFAAALREASEAGVHISAIDCRVTPDSMVLQSQVPIELYPQTSF